MLLLTSGAQIALSSYYCTLRQAVLKSAKKVAISRQPSAKKLEKKEKAKTGAKSIARLTNFFFFCSVILLMVNGYCALYGLDRVLGDRTIPLPSNDPNSYSIMACTYTWLSS